MTVDFFASMTAAPSDFRKIEALLKEVRSEHDPLAHILTTPLFMSQEALGFVRRFQEERPSEVCFDSAGYYVQMGKIGYHELYMKLLTCYRTNRWADRYVLPDNVPLSSDSRERVAEKVRETVHYSCLFFEEMPDELKEKAMPVVHGHTRAQVEYCLEQYLKLGVKWVGFGSFGTSGKNNEANMATTSAVENARLVAQIAAQYGVKTHLFGIGAPALVGMIYSTGAAAFDSASWFKAAGFGQVHLPLMRSYNITYNNGLSELQQGITWEDFTRFKRITDHSCLYCQDYQTLAGHKMHRVIHNLLAVNESVHILNAGQFERAKAIYEQGSLKYREEYKQWLPLTRS
jgi:queuine/archaeosine tRNA-ribosyltransferase